MRADRLLSLLMLLQARGRVTAQELARELEVSERTIYRDINALCIAGIPIYGVPGTGGGYGLVDSYRTDLTGLSEGEARALFMLSIPEPLADLGLREELRAALLKLSAALPDAHRGSAVFARQRFHLDATWWRQNEEQVPHLQTIHRAVWEDRKLHVVYRPAFAIEIERLVAPYALVAKAGVWYVVFARNGALSVHRVSRLRDVRLSEASFERPGEFDLAAFWETWTAEHEALLRSFTAIVRVAPKLVPALPHYFGSAIRDRIAEAGRDDEQESIRLELSFESFEAARDRLLSFGRGVEVLEPRALRRSVHDHAEQIVDLYASLGDAKT